ncbi:MAG: sulfotransferase [Pirellulaceae bacterium]
MRLLLRMRFDNLNQMESQFMRTDYYFVLSPSYHGATVLAALLNNHSRISCLGDTFPKRSFTQTCTCRKTVWDCPFWSQLYKALELRRFESEERWIPRFPQLMGSASHGALNRMANLAMLAYDQRLAATGNFFRSARRSHMETYTRFIDYVKQSFGSPIFVDGSKQLFMPLFLQTYFGHVARINIIHLMRDPRAFAFSSVYKSQAYSSVSCSAKAWLKYHQRVKRFGATLNNQGRYIQVHYEDLCASPKHCLDNIQSFLGARSECLDRPVVSQRKHHLMGNASIFDFGGKLKASEKFRSALSATEQQAVRRVTDEFYSVQRTTDSANGLRRRVA